MCQMFGHIIDIFWSHSNHVQNMTRPLDTSTFQKTISWCPKSVQSLGTFWTYFGHIMHIWTCFLTSLSGVQNLSNIWTSFWTYLTGLDVFWAHFGHIRCFGHILDMLWTLLDMLWTLLDGMCPKCVHPPIVLEHPNLNFSCYDSDLAELDSR